MDTALSDEVSVANENGKKSLIRWKDIIERTVAIKIRPETNTVFLKFSGLTNPNSFYVMLRTLILQIAIINVENDQKRPFAIKPIFEK